jgi:hypothetical protein
MDLKKKKKKKSTVESEISQEVDDQTVHLDGYTTNN